MFFPILLGEVRQGLLFRFSFKEHKRSGEQQIAAGVHDLPIDLSKIFHGKAGCSCANLVPTYYRLFALFRKVPHLTDLSLTADVRRMSANDALSRHLFYLAE